MNLNGAIKGIVGAAGGPIGALLNPNALRAIGENVRMFAETLPPAPVLVAAGVALGRDALVKEWRKAPPSERFMATCRASGKFETDEHIIAFRDLLLGEI